MNRSRFVLFAASLGSVASIALHLSPTGCTTSSSKGNTATTTLTPTDTPCSNAWRTVGSMTTARENLATAPVTVGGVPGVLAMGGFYGGAPSTAEFYNPGTNSWSSVANMTTARVSLAAAPVSVGGVSGVLAMGGWNPSPGGGDPSTAEFYNPGTNSWSLVASMTAARVCLAAAPVTVGGVAGVLAVGGSGTSGYLSSAEFYDPGTNSWSPVASMTTVRERLAAAPVTVGGVAGVLAMGGFIGGSSYLSTAEFYDPGANSWSPVASMTTAREYLAAAAMTIGGVPGVFAVGGSNGSSDLSTVEFYNPGANSWSPVGSMTTAREGLAAAPVMVGGGPSVLAVGGFVWPNSFLSTAEFYCP